MKLNQQFLKLHSLYGSLESAVVTLDELAGRLECTHRNATNIIRKMSDNGWIAWDAYRGRGRRSTLRFLVQPEEIAVQSMMQAINRKDMSQAIEQIRAHRRSSTLQEHLQGWLLSYFGHHSEIKSDKQIDTLRIPIRQKLHTFDPLYMNLLAESFVSSHVFDGLARRTDKPDEILPAIAHAWEADESRTVWTFHLRKEVLFHHGKIMTAEDVVYSFERLIRSSRRTLYSFIYKPIKSVRALTPTTVRFELEEPNELFLPFLCTSRAAIVPKDLGQMGTGRFGSMPMGTGPFKVTEMSESVCVLEVFAPYFQARAHLDRVEIVHVPWETENSHGEVLSPFHVIHSPSAAEVNWSQIHSGTTIRKFVTCNTKKAGPLNDPTVRAHVLDCLRGSDTNQPAVVPPNNEGDRVLQIATIPQYRQDAEALAQSLEHSGYACKVVSPSPEEFKGDIRLESDLIVFSLIRDQDEQLRLFDLYLTIAEHVDAHNRIDIGNILAAAVKEPDARVRAAHLKHVEESLIRDHHLCILSERPLPTAYLPSVRGVTFNSQGWVNLRTIWFPPVME